MGNNFFCIFLQHNSHIVLNKILMVQLSFATSLQITGMNDAGLSCREIRCHLDQNHTVISRLVQKYLVKPLHEKLGIIMTHSTLPPFQQHDLER